MSDMERQQLVRRMLVALPKFGYWATSIQDFETPFGWIGYRQIELLWAIRHHLIAESPVTPSSIAAHFEIQPSVVTRLLSKLETHEFVTRIVDPHDGRSWHIEITERGMQVSEYVEVLYDQEIMAAMTFLDDTQIRELGHYVDVLDRIAATLLEGRKGRSAEPTPHTS